MITFQNDDCGLGWFKKIFFWNLSGIVIQTVPTDDLSICAKNYNYSFLTSFSTCSIHHNFPILSNNRHTRILVQYCPTKIKPTIITCIYHSNYCLIHSFAVSLIVTHSVTLVSTIYVLVHDPVNPCILYKVKVLCCKLGILFLLSLTTVLVED